MVVIMGNKLYLAMFLILFWFLLPFPMQKFGLGGVSEIPDREIEQPKNAIDYFGVVWDSIKVYFSLLVFNIPNVNDYIRYFINALQISTFVLLIYTIRGDWLTECKRFCKGLLCRRRDVKTKCSDCGTGLCSMCNISWKGKPYCSVCIVKPNINWDGLNKDIENLFLVEKTETIKDIVKV